LNIEESARAVFDEKRIGQVVYNFLNNALNHNDKDDKQITLGLRQIKGVLCIYVEDNGEGIKEEDLNKIWERYYKVDREHKRYHIGSGIGLSLCKTILSEHHLAYGVESSYGEGSCFYFAINEEE